MSLRVLMPLALLVLVSAALPTNIGGWGPREGVMERVGPELSDRGVGRLRIDGSGNIHTQFFTAESTPRPARVFIHTAGRAQRAKARSNGFACAAAGC